MTHSKKKIWKKEWTNLLSFCQHVSLSSTKIACTPWFLGKFLFEVNLLLFFLINFFPFFQSLKIYPPAPNPFCIEFGINISFLLL